MRQRSAARLPAGNEAAPGNSPHALIARPTPRKRGPPIGRPNAESVAIDGQRIPWGRLGAFLCVVLACYHAAVAVSRATRRHPRQGMLSRCAEKRRKRGGNYARGPPFTLGIYGAPQSGKTRRRAQKTRGSRPGAPRSRHFHDPAPRQRAPTPPMEISRTPLVSAPVFRGGRRPPPLLLRGRKRINYGGPATNMLNLLQKRRGCIRPTFLFPRLSITSVRSLCGTIAF